MLLVAGFALVLAWPMAQAATLKDARTGYCTADNGDYVLFDLASGSLSGRYYSQAGSAILVNNPYGDPNSHPYHLLQLDQMEGEALSKERQIFTTVYSLVASSPAHTSDALAPEIMSVGSLGLATVKDAVLSVSGEGVFLYFVPDGGATLAEPAQRCEFTF